ncbi:MAG: carboxypeptidase-like regulatory domain-containing protein [Candidatus Thermoplasmatota archaeon]
MRGIAFLAVASLFLAGCSGAGDESTSTVDPFAETPDLASGKGLIRGLVLTPGLVPVKGAIVELPTFAPNQTTDDNGAFVFADLEPGTYFLKVSKPGWTTLQQSADVAANDPEPAILKIAIERIPGAEPRALTLRLNGYISCSIGLPVTFLDCNTIEEQMSRLHFGIEGKPDWIQTEILWQSSQPTGDWLYVIQGLCSCEGGIPDVGGARFNETAEARSLHVARASPGFLKEHEVGSAEAKELVIDVSASGPEPATTNGSGIALSQKFEVFATFFYNLDPDPAWTFVEDGDYPVPDEP